MFDFFGTLRDRIVTGLVVDIAPIAPIILNVHANLISPRIRLFRHILIVTELILNYHILFHVHLTTLHLLELRTVNFEVLRKAFLFRSVRFSQIVANISQSTPIHRISKS